MKRATLNLPVNSLGAVNAPILYDEIVPLPAFGADLGDLIDALLPGRIIRAARHGLRAWRNRTRTVRIIMPIRRRGPFGIPYTGLRVIKAHVDGETYRRLPRRPTSLAELMCAAR